MHKFKNLDGLRGLAALVVVFCHYANGFIPAFQTYPTATHHTRYDNLITATPLHLAFGGNFAVYIFFVLSGFVLSYKFFTTKDLKVITSSAVRRYLRLMVPAFGSVLLAYVVLRFGLMFNQQTSIISGSQGWLNTFWTFPARLGDAVYQGVYGTFFMGQSSYDSSLWTMQFELYGSFLVFMIMALFGKLNKRWFFYAVFIALFLRSTYLAFILGMVLSDLWVNVPRFKTIISQHVAYLFLTIGLFAGSWYVTTDDIYGLYSIPLFNSSQLPTFAHTIAALLVIIAVLQLGWLSRVFEHRILQFLGRISFSLYLLHVIFLGSLASFLFNHLIWRIGYGPAFLASFIPTLAITLVASHFYTKYVDDRAILISRSVGNYLLSDKKLFKEHHDEVADTLPRDLTPVPEVVTVPIE